MPMTLQPATKSARSRFQPDVLLAKRQGQPPVKFYFDRQSSLLVRLVRYAESP